MARSANDNGWMRPAWTLRSVRRGTAQAMPVNRGEVILAYCRTSAARRKFAQR